VDGKYRLSHVRAAQPRLAVVVAQALEARLADVGSVRLARPAASGALTHQPLGTGEAVLSTLWPAPHPHRHLVLDREDGFTRPAFSAGRALTVLAVHHGAGRGFRIILNTPLAVRARTVLTRRPAGRNREGIRAEESFRATGGVGQLAWAATPTVATQQSRLAGGVLVCRDADTGLPFLAHTVRDAVAHPGACS